MVIEGGRKDSAPGGAGRVPSAALPGQSGNVGITAHRDTLLRPLRNIQLDDVITLTSLQGVYRYRVVSTKIVMPDISVLDTTVSETLTLVTVTRSTTLAPPRIGLSCVPKRLTADWESGS